ncbi:MAG TPA: hypothetical protein PKY59_19005 [Pyrinomonadaceae bacterium]|nr:hypothetical protein [Pyrinomonadaceae bacterium]
MKNRDWMPSTRAGKFAMFNNFRAKIEGYQTIFGFDNDLKARIFLICETFAEIYQKSEQINASKSDLSAWLDAILNGKPRGELAPAAPVFPTISVPEGAFIGILEEFREIVNHFKNHLNYTENIGLDLMIEGEDREPQNFNETAPTLKVSAKNDTDVEISFKRGDAELLEVVYRKAGTETWMFADKTTNSPLVHKPQFTTPGQAEKFEYRAIYLVKNERVGQWSPIYTVTLG